MDNPIIAFLSARRSVKPDRLVSPGPSPAELETMLTIASRVPDHKKLAPWRFIVLEGPARCRVERYSPPRAVYRRLAGGGENHWL